VADSDASALVAFCASILSDGEVTEDEAYDLAEWLNDHSDLAKVWPATELIQPLQSIWADAATSKRELHRLARILISIQREWPKRVTNRPASAKALPELVYREASEPRLPSLKFEANIPSRGEAGVFYKVDLAGPSCSCPDWRGRRSRLPAGHLTRCCKHVFDAFAQLPQGLPTADWLEAFVELAWPAPPRTEWQLITINSHQVLYSSASDKGWANCFAKDGSGYERFGYNIEERRWAYGSQPKSAWAISEAIVALGNKAPSHEPPRNLSQANQIEASGRTARRFAFASLAVVLAIILVAVAVRLTNPRSETAQRSRQAKATTQARVPIAVSDPAGATRRAVETAAQRAAPPSAPWTAKTTRAVRIKAGGQEILIPKGASVRVVGRSASDVLVSYAGSTATIPASATDLR
jgi:hypothetical protein